MNEILQQYDPERIAEFADEGDPRHKDEAPYCCEKGCDEPVEFQGETCPICRQEDADIAAIAIMRGRAFDVESESALRTIDRAISYVSAGRFRVSPVESLVIPNHPKVA